MFRKAGRRKCGIFRHFCHSPLSTERYIVLERTHMDFVRGSHIWYHNNVLVDFVQVASRRFD